MRFMAAFVHGRSRNLSQVWDLSYVYVSYLESSRIRFRSASSESSTLTADAIGRLLIGLEWCEKFPPLDGRLVLALAWLNGGILACDGVDSVARSVDPAPPWYSSPVVALYNAVNQRW